MDVAYIYIVVPSGKSVDKPDYCVIKFSVGDEPGTLVRALKVFHVSLMKFLVLVQILILRYYSGGCRIS